MRVAKGGCGEVWGGKKGFEGKKGGSDKVGK